MLDNLIKESIDHLEGSFYDKPFKFSYSSLSKLLFSPAVFYQIYILGQKEDKDLQHLVEGSLIHYLLLENKDINDKYIISPDVLPTGQIKLLIDTVYSKCKNLLEKDPDLELEQVEQQILDTMVSINYYQKIKTDSDRLKKVITTETKNYWDFLKKKGNKILIDQDTLKFCEDSVEIIKNTPRICDLIGCTPEQNVDVYNEQYMECDLSKQSFGLKGILDNLKIDHNNKIIYINDFKTSGKSLSDFGDSVEFYSYWLQAVIYMIIVSNNYFDLLEKGYDLRFHFIVIDKYFNVYPFPVSDKTRNEWLNRFNKTLEVAEHHYKNRRYSLPYEFDIQSVVL